MSIEAKAREIVEDFGLFDEWDDKYAYIIDLGKSLPPINSELKTDENIIKGCQSRVWLAGDFDGELMRYQADSDAYIPKGIVALVLKVLDEEKPADIAQARLDFIDEIGLKEHLSPTRSNGLVSMVNKMKELALQHV